MIASRFPGKSAAVLTNSGTFQINLIVFTKSGSVDPVEHLLALLDNHAVAGKLLLIEGHCDGRHLLVVDGHAALLDQPPGFAGGSAQAAGHQQFDDADFAIGKPGFRQLRCLLYTSRCV